MRQSIRILIGAFLSALYVQPLAHADALLTQDEFREALIRELETRGDADFCVHAVEDGGIRAGLKASDCQYYAYVTNAYSTYEKAPETLASIVSGESDRMMRIINAGKDLSDFSNRLVVQVRPSAFIDSAVRAGYEDVVTRDFAGDLMAVLMLDSAETLATVTTEQLEKTGLTSERAFAIALQNTRDRMGHVYQMQYEKLTYLTSENGLITGEVALPETCVAGGEEAVFFIYDYNGVLRVNREDVLAVSELLSFARTQASKGDALTDSVIACKAGEWSQLWPAPLAEASLDRYAPHG